MLVIKRNMTVISHLYKGEVLTMEESGRWSSWMRNVRNYSGNTITSYLKSLERFWIWSLHNPPHPGEEFLFYQSRYRKILLEGIEITDSIRPDGDVGEFKLVELSIPPLSMQAVNREMAALRSFFEYTEQLFHIEDGSTADLAREANLSRRSALSSVEIRKSEGFLHTFGKKASYLRPYRIPKKSRNEIKAFPFSKYVELLGMASPRERLIYLLCGACSARIGQALSLTVYDIDFDKRQVWLIDPTGSEPRLVGVPRKAWLKSEYGIGIDTDPVHGAGDLKFKYPIPLRREPLFWLRNEFRDLFFETLGEYRRKGYVPEHARATQHPFLFTTKTGLRLRPRQINDTFHRHMEKLGLGGGGKTAKGIHSLRHMFGMVMAEAYAGSGDETIMHICMDAMGHSRIESTLCYFNVTPETKQRIISDAANQIFGRIDG